MFSGGSTAQRLSAAAVEPAARMADARRACERFFMMLRPSDVMVLIPGVRDAPVQDRHCGAAQ